VLKPGLFELIRSEHEIIRLLTKRVLDPSLSDKACKDAYGDLRREIARHAMAEEDALYGALKGRSGTADFVRISSVHHATMDRLVTMLDKMQARSTHWPKAIRELCEEIVNHMDYEERELRRLFPSVVPAARPVPSMPVPSPKRASLRASA
jgi:hemerythrin superfamily protein